MWLFWVPASYIAYCSSSVFYCTVQHYIRVESEKLWLKSHVEKSLSSSFSTEWVGRICLEIGLWLYALKYEGICSPGFYFSCLNVIHVASENYMTSVRHRAEWGVQQLLKHHGFQPSVLSCCKFQVILTRRIVNCDNWSSWSLLELWHKLLEHFQFSPGLHID